MFSSSLQYFVVYRRGKKLTKNSSGIIMFVPDSFSFCQAFSYPRVSAMPAVDTVRLMPALEFSTAADQRLLLRK